MKIHIIYEFKEGPWGGANQFLKTLKLQLAKRNMYEEEVEKADVALFNSHHCLKKVLALKKKYLRMLFIHRIDGPVSLVRGHKSTIDNVIYEYNRLIADATIFQSQWSLRENYAYGMSHNDFETVITNVPDPTIFYPLKDKSIPNQRKMRLIATSWSANMRKGFDIYKYLDDHLDFKQYEMTFVGNSPIRFNNIQHVVPQPSDKLADLLRAHDMFITASMNDPCSNSLIEALSCGLPAVVRNSGGLPEIVGKGGISFEEPHDVLTAITQMRDHLAQYRAAITIRDSDTAINAYYAFCKEMYDRVQAGTYTPKKLSFLNFWRLKFI
ncbi:MAG: glycosyltransferase [Candidatus Omnitrophica bacterium]|nr:glycosyltransferase [Candidatus Omnitrophota bacterium]